MAEIPVNRFYPPNKKSPAVISLEKHFQKKSTFEHGVDFDFTKSRSLSTSTPLLQKGDGLKFPSRSTSTSAFFDSGYADSFGLSSNSLSISNSTTAASSSSSPVTSSASFVTPCTESNYTFDFPHHGQFTPVTPQPVHNNPKDLHTVTWGDSCVRWGDCNYYISDSELGASSNSSCQDDVPIWTPQHRLDFTSDDEEDADVSMDDSFNHHMIPYCYGRSGDEPSFCSERRQSDNFSILSENFPDPQVNLEEQFHKVLQMFTPKAPDRLIGRKIGLVDVDILSELDYRNIPCLSRILNLLSPADLCRVCMVSRSWKELCIRDHRSNKRRLKYLKTKQFYVDKENLGKKKSTRQARGLTTGQETLATLQNTLNVEAVPGVPLSQNISTTIIFQNAASSLKSDESLLKCPKCSSPSRVLPAQDRGQCCNENCKFDYCIKCLNDFHKSQTCSTTKRSKSTLIGSKKSKKNLRRL